MLISVVTINFNNVDGLAATIESVKKIGAIDTVDFEHILIDGGSDDGSTELIQNYHSNFDFVKFVSEQDNGIFDAMNKAINMAKGSYILFINSGDEIVNFDWIDVLKIEDGFDVFIFSTIFKYKNYEVHRIAKEPLNFYWGLPFCHQSVLVRSSMMKNNKFNTDSLYADYELFMHLKDLAAIKVYNIPLARYVTGGISDIVTFARLKNFIRIHKRYWGVKSYFLYTYMSLRIIKKKLYGTK